MFFDQKNTLYGDLGIIEVVSSLPLCLSGGDQMMPQGIIRNSLGDASRHHQGVKGFNQFWYLFSDVFFQWQIEFQGEHIVPGIIFYGQISTAWGAYSPFSHDSHPTCYSHCSF